MFGKIFSQIFDSSIVESPATRFTLMDMIVLADPNGVVDMTHEAIARRTNRSLDTIKKTIAVLEGPDPKSRTADHDGARLKRLDEHREWGWAILNYGKFRETASEDQRREKTRARVHKFRGKTELKERNASVTLCNARNAKKKKRNKNQEEEIYNVYPLKVGKPKALMAIQKALEKMGWTELFGKTSDYAKARNGDLSFVPHAATWFNQERFNDDPATWKPNGAHQKLNGESNRNLGTANEGKSSQYRGVGVIRSVSNIERPAA